MKWSASGTGGDAVADGEFALEVLLGRIVLDAEQLAEVEAGLVDVVVVVLYEARALAHHPLAEPIHELGVALVVGDGEQPARPCRPRASELANSAWSSPRSWWR